MSEAMGRLSPATVKSASATHADLRVLIQDMARWRHMPEKDTHVIVVSVASAVPKMRQSDVLMRQIADAVGEIAAKHPAKAYAVTDQDFALILKGAEQTVVDVIRDLKIQLLRSIERHCAGTFGTIDQSRLVVSYDLENNYRSAADRIAKYAQAEQKAAEMGGEDKQLRPLTDEDVRKVMQAYKQFGPDKFLKAFVRSQAVVVSKNKVLAPVMIEYFISMDLLRKPLFIDVEMRGTGKMFDEFTLVLDQILLRAFKRIENSHGPCSINLNVESVFTKAFEMFLDEVSRDRLAEITFEFRQPNIVENFDEFLVARGLIRSKGARIAVDRIFPQTLGLIDLEYIGASIAKVHWRAGADEVLKERGRAVQYMRDCGVLPVLIRVDEAKAFDAAADVGINMFQGFLIDDMIRQQAA